MKTKQLLHFIPELGIANLIYQDEDQAATSFQTELGTANIIHKDEDTEEDTDEEIPKYTFTHSKTLDDCCLVLHYDYLFSYLSTHTVYQYKIKFFHYFEGIWPYWKMDTGKHNFHEILLF